jgi:hypothetical protein
MLAVAPYKQWKEHLTFACASFAAGRFRRVVLADVPPIKRRLSATRKESEKGKTGS